MSPASPLIRRSAGRRVAAGMASVVVLLALILAACSSDANDGSSSDSTAAGDTATTVANTTSLDDVTVDGALGEKPTVTFDPSFAATEDVVKVIEPGTGPVVESGQLVTFDFLTISGTDGTEQSTSFDASQPAPSVTVGNDQILPVVSQAMVGQPVGTRVLAATDKSGQTEGTWTLFVFDIKAAATPLSEPSGETVTPPAGLPTVGVENGAPTLTMPGGDPPTDLVVQPLIKGTGPEVQTGQTLVVNYIGAIWGSGTVFDSSYSRGQAFTVAIGAGQVIPGWDEGLVGQTVGSRVLLVIPPDKGYGAQGSSDGTISGTDTIVFVVDILAGA